ncbi:MAG: hypothetical protein WBJ13_10200 [Sedimentibacter sp.]
MTVLNVNLKTNKYDILMQKGILDNLGFEIQKIYSGVRIAVITDKNVYSIYGGTIGSSRKTILLDKKNISENINLILFKKIGEAFIAKMPVENIDNFL